MDPRCKLMQVETLSKKRYKLCLSALNRTLIFSNAFVWLQKTVMAMNKNYVNHSLVIIIMMIRKVNPKIE